MRVAKFTKVCSYDRAGYAWSDKGPEPRGLGTSAAELHQSHIASEAFLAGLSRNSQFVVARRSFHQVRLYEPNLVIDAIRQVVIAVRSGKKLGSAK